MKSKVIDLIIQAAAKTLSTAPGKLSGETNLEKDFGAKSINFVQIIGELEDEYEVEIDFMKFRNASTIDKQAEFVASLI